MNFLKSIAENAPLLRSLIAVGCSLLVLALAHWLLIARWPGKEHKVGRQVVMLVLTGIAVIVVVFAFSKSIETAEMVVAVLGLLVSVGITISSTTFTSNAMAGWMLRAVRNFRVGDFVRVGDQFGRVTERGLFHTEIQTEDRDLATIPNMYLVSHPVKVVRASGTIVSTTLSLGYDIPHTDVKVLLGKAASAAELQDPFVYLTKLGDFSITYQVAGFLPEVKHLLSARSRLRSCVLDALHGAGIEIVSPSFMNQRQLSEDAVVPPSRPSIPAELTLAEDSAPEDMMFDKAERAESIESLRAEQTTLAKEIKDLEGRLPKADDAERSTLEAEIQRCRSRSEVIEWKLSEANESDDSRAP